MMDLIDSVPVLGDPLVVAVDRGGEPAPPDWESRSLYIGEDGAGRWLGLLHEPSYTLHGHDAYRLREHRLAAVAERGFRTLVSLGPGDGGHDRELVRALRGREPGLSYIPVEIGRGLLATAVRTLRDEVAIPVAVLADFERDRATLGEALERFAARPALFSLLGGTLGNLDRGEPGFFDGMRAVMRPGDAFLLDVPLAGPGWTPRDDPRLDPSRYTNGFRNFLRGGLEVRGLAAGPADGWFERRVACRLDRDETIPGTRVISVRDAPSGRVLLRFRRYDWDAIRTWLRGRGFSLAFVASSLGSPGETFGMGVIVLTADERPTER